MNEELWDSNNNLKGFRRKDENVDYVFERTNLLLLKMRLGGISRQDYLNPPPRPRRVSSAKPDTVNPPGVNEQQDSDCFESDGELKSSCCTEHIVTSEGMGSSPSMHQEPSLSIGTYSERTTDLLTLSHARVHNENEPPSEYDNDKSESFVQSQMDFNTPHRAPMKAIHFSQSTFKGSSMSAVTLPRNHETSSHPLLTSIFPQKGKYKFQRNDLTSDPTKSSTIRQDSAKLHQSESPDFTFTMKSQSSTVMSESEQKTAMTYGTLRKSNTTGSVSELFSKSRMKVRNSLRNWKLSGKLEKSVDDTMTHDIMVRRPELYDVTLAKPDNFDDVSSDWMSSSHDSAMMSRRKRPKKEIIPVKTPVVKTSSSPPLNATEERSDNSRIGDVTMDSNVTSQSMHESRDNPKNSELESIEMLDSVIKSHARHRHSTGTSVSLTNSENFNSPRRANGQRPGQKSGAYTHPDSHPAPNSTFDEPMKTDLTREHRAHQRSSSLDPQNDPRFTLSQDDSVFYQPTIKTNLIDPTMTQQSGLFKPNRNKFLTLPSPRGQEDDSLVIRKMAGSPKMRRTLTDPDRLTPISSSVENLISDSKGMYSPYGSMSAVSLKATPNVTPEIHGHGSPTVVTGMSVTDVLSQEYSGMRDDASLYESPRQRFDESAFDESAYSEMNSFEGSSNSFTESQVTSEGEEFEEIVSSGGATRKTGWLSLKPLLVAKRGRLEKSSKRKWQKFWVNLKGDQLLFSEPSDVSTTDGTSHPAFILPVDGAIVQAMPEHATKNNVMCISLSNGNVYLLQALSQMEVRNWIYGLHIEAATSLARGRCQDPANMTKRFIRDVLEGDLEKMKTEILEEEKMRKMAGLQSSLVSDAKSQRTIHEQIAKWERNAERNQVHSFRLRCYLASLESVEQPNPQPAIAAARKSSKQVLSNLKCFNIATLHSLVQLKVLNERSPRKRSMTLNLKRSGSFADAMRDGSQSDRTVPSKQKKNIFGSLRGFDSWKGSNGVKRKTMQRTPITGILTALTSSSSSHSSTKHSDDKLRSSSGKNFPLLPPPSGEYDSANDRAPDTPSEDDTLDDSLAGSLDSLLLSPIDAWMPIELQSSSVRVAVATNDYVTVTLTQKMNARQLLEIVCQRKQLYSNSHFLVAGDDETEVKGHELVSEIDRKLVRVKKKKQYEIEIESQSSDFGIIFKQPKTLCRPLEIESITPGGVADSCGIAPYEEIIVINGDPTLNMEDSDVKQAVTCERLRLLIQTTQPDPNSKLKTWWVDSDDSSDENNSVDSDDRGKAKINHLMAVMEEYLKKIVVPPPPVVSKLQPCFIRSPFSVVPINCDAKKKRDSIEDILSALTIPSPNGEKSEHCDESTTHNGTRNENCDELIQQLLQKAETVTKMCRLLRSLSVPSLFSDKQEPDVLSIHQRNDIEKIWKVLEELVETETNYVVDLDALLHRFLEPLHAEGFLSNPAMEPLLMSVRNIVNFQQAFLEELSQSFSKSMNRSDIETLNSCLISVSSTFLQHAAQFKLYAVFCSCHTVAQDLIEQTKSPTSEVRAFLDARNPKQQHSLSLDSYLIKPIQRVLKYPLLLRELLTLSESLDVVDTKARRRLKASLHAMHAVARHINDSQTVHDEFGMQGFQEIMEQAALMALGCIEIATSLTLTNLFCYCSAEWLNAPDHITVRRKKGSFLEMLVLVFRSSVVLLCRSTKQRKNSRTPQNEAFPSYARAVTTDFIFTDVIPRENISISGRCQGFQTILEISSSDIDIEPRVYRLLCSTIESKQRVMKSVRYIIKESSKTPREQNSNESRLSDSVTDDFTPRSINSAISTPPSQHRFFYLPTKQSEPDEAEPASSSQTSKIPITLPLPCYETTQPTGRGVRSRKSRHTKTSLSNRRSGLYITMNPQRLSDNNFKQLLPHNDDDSNKKDSSRNQVEEKLRELPEMHQSDLSSTEHNSDHGDDQSSVSSASDVVQPVGNESASNLSQHHSPARYPVSYEVSSFEGNF